MYVIEAPEPGVFLEHLPPDALVRVVRMATTQLVRRRNFGVTSVPAIELTYSFMNGDEQWMFREILVGDANNRGGQIDLSSTLWAHLVSQRIAHEVVQRSGSF